MASEFHACTYEKGIRYEPKGYKLGSKANLTINLSSNSISRQDLLEEKNTDTTKYVL